MSRGVSGKLSLAKTERLLELMTEEVPVFRRNAGVAADTCILHAHLAIEMLRVAGGRARPFPVKVRAMSPEMVRRVEAGQPVPEDDDAEGIAEWQAAGAVACAIGYGGANGKPVAANRYDGHLCALIAERYLLDLTSDQLGMRRPTIDVPPFWTVVPRGFVRGETGITFDSPNGSRAAYFPNLGCKDYLLGDGEHPWRSDSTERETARKLLRAIGWRG